MFPLVIRGMPYPSKKKRLDYKIWVYPILNSYTHNNSTFSLKSSQNILHFHSRLSLGNIILLFLRHLKAQNPLKYI